MKNLGRNEFLNYYFEAHNVGFSFCQKIRIGIRKGVELERIKSFADWFYANELLPHMILEEELMDKVLGKTNDFVKKSMTKHRRIKRLFTQPNELLKQLNFIEEELECSIRFENKQFIQELEKCGTMLDDFIQKIPLKKLPSFQLNWKDEFWN